MCIDIGGIQLAGLHVPGLAGGILCAVDPQDPRIGCCFKIINKRLVAHALRTLAAAGHHADIDRIHKLGIRLSPGKCCRAVSRLCGQIRNGRIGCHDLCSLGFAGEAPARGIGIVILIQLKGNGIRHTGLQTCDNGRMLFRRNVHAAQIFARSILAFPVQAHTVGIDRIPGQGGCRRGRCLDGNVLHDGIQCRERFQMLALLAAFRAVQAGIALLAEAGPDRLCILRRTPGMCCLFDRFGLRHAAVEAGMLLLALCLAGGILGDRPAAPFMMAKRLDDDSFRLAAVHAVAHIHAVRKTIDLTDRRPSAPCMVAVFLCHAAPVVDHEFPVANSHAVLRIACGDRRQGSAGIHIEFINGNMCILEPGIVIDRIERRSDLAAGVLIELPHRGIPVINARSLGITVVVTVTLVSESSFGQIGNGGEFRIGVAVCRAAVDIVICRRALDTVDHDGIVHRIDVFRPFALEADAAVGDLAPGRTKIIRKCDPFELRHIEEGSHAKLGHPAGDVQRADGRLIECIGADARQGIRQTDLGQQRAVAEGTAADPGHALGNGDRFELRAAAGHIEHVGRYRPYILAEFCLLHACKAAAADVFHMTGVVIQHRDHRDIRLVLRIGHICIHLAVAKEAVRDLRDILTDIQLVDLCIPEVCIDRIVVFQGSIPIHTEVLNICILKDAGRKPYRISFGAVDHKIVKLGIFKCTVTDRFQRTLTDRKPAAIHAGKSIGEDRHNILWNLVFSHIFFRRPCQDRTLSVRIRSGVEHTVLGHVFLVAFIFHSKRIQASHAAEGAETYVRNACRNGDRSLCPAVQESIATDGFQIVRKVEIRRAVLTVIRGGLEILELVAVTEGIVPDLLDLEHAVHILQLLAVAEGTRTDLLHMIPQRDRGQGGAVIKAVLRDLRELVVTGGNREQRGAAGKAALAKGRSLFNVGAHQRGASGKGLCTDGIGAADRTQVDILQRGAAVEGRISDTLHLSGARADDSAEDIARVVELHALKCRTALECTVRDLRDRGREGHGGDLRIADKRIRRNGRDSLAFVGRASVNGRHNRPRQIDIRFGTLVPGDRDTRYVVFHIVGVAEILVEIFHELIAVRNVRFCCGCSQLHPLRDLRECPRRQRGKLHSEHGQRGCTRKDAASESVHSISPPLMMVCCLRPRIGVFRLRRSGHILLVISEFVK